MKNIDIQRIMQSAEGSIYDRARYAVSVVNPSALDTIMQWERTAGNGVAYSELMFILNWSKEDGIHNKRIINISDNGITVVEKTENGFLFRFATYEESEMTISQIERWMNA